MHDIDYRPRIEYKLIPCGVLHWGAGDLQAPKGTLTAIYTTLRRYLLIRHQPRLIELRASSLMSRNGRVVALLVLLTLLVNSWILLVLLAMSSTRARR